MWYPPPPVEPPVFQLHSVTCQDFSAGPMWQVIPFDQVLNFLDISQGFRNEPLYIDDGRKRWLMRSLFKLVWKNNCLELTNPKLHRWFQYLTIEDRILIEQDGGLLQFLSKHPALEVTDQYIYVKSNVSRKGYHPTLPTDMSRYPTFYGASQCQNCGTICPFGTRNCNHCGVHVLENEKQLEQLQNSIKEELKVMSGQNDITKLNIHIGCMQNDINTIGTQRYGHRSPAAHPPLCSKGVCPQTWSQSGKVENTNCFKDTAAQASFSLDMELDIQSQVQNDYAQNDQQVDHSLDQEVMSTEYYSFSSTSLDHNTWSDGSRSSEAGYMDSITATKGSTEVSSEISDSANASAANVTNCFSCLSDSFELAEESKNAHEDLEKKHDSKYEQQIEEINVGSALKPKCSASVFVDQITDACGDFRACFTSTCGTEVGPLFQVNNVATDTDFLAVHHEKESQTVQMITSDKNTITEVYMSDLEVLTEEFIKLKEMEKELKQLKSRQASTDGDHCRRVCECGCAQRVRKAELRLLALQYFMCQQHCWRCCFTSPLGEVAYDRTEALPDSIANTLKKLQKEYNEMRRLILAGISLDDLKPLSVNTENITTGTNYSPASVLEAHLNSYDCPGRAECSIIHGHGVDEECKETRTLEAEACDDTDTAQKKAKDEGSRRDETNVLPHNQPVSSTETTPGALKDPNASEAWFDAEEELGFQDEKMDKQNKERKRTDEDESKSSLLCVSCLPDSVTENELLVWFEKYSATNVCISSFSNNMRTAVVYVKSPDDAKAAVKDLNGHLLQGHTVQVVQLCGPAQPTPNDHSHSTPEIHETETAGDGLGTKSVTYSPPHGGPRCSVDRLTNVCDLPTASGTYVPQHYTTMGSFDTIMARLLERHPNVSRQRIIDALLELRAKHQGFLSGLSLRSIVEMTSELLTQASTPT